MTDKLQTTTKYPGVFKDTKSGYYFYQTELGTDRISGKRIRRKSRKDRNGKTFTTALSANKELTRIKKEYYEINSYSNYQMTYAEFMDKIYVPAYKTEVEESTFGTKEAILRKIRNRFAKKKLRNFSIEDIQNFKTFLLSSIDDGGNGYSKSYASLIFGTFRKTLDKAEELQYIERNISKKIKPIPKSQAIVPYWNAREFSLVLNQICIDNFIENLYFVMLWTYFMTGIRVNEGMALWWNDIDLDKKILHVHHMLILKSRTNWKRNNYTKTSDGKRTISLDDETVTILKRWKSRQQEIGLGGDSDFIFTYDGLPMIKSTLSRVLKRYAGLANISPIQGKGLRHSHASYLINEFNVSVLVLSKRMGHSSPEITLKHYSHMWSGADEEIVEKMNGNIKYKTAEKSKIEFNGNQVVKNILVSSPPNTPPKNCKLA